MIKLQITMHIKPVGDWTEQLYNLLPQPLSSNKKAKEMPLKIYMEGPYGAGEIDLESKKYKLFLLISGGIGVTPIQSICNHLVHQHEDQGRPIKKIAFIWSCADKFLVASAFERDRQWAKAKPNSLMTRLPSLFQMNTPMENGLGRQLSVDHNILTRSRTFDNIPSTKTNSANKHEVDILHTEFYLTREEEKTFQRTTVQNYLQPYLRFGRPNYAEIFVSLRYYAIQCREKNVAVCVCGPRQMVDEIRALTSSCSQDGVSFDFHGEVFEF